MVKMSSDCPEITKMILDIIYGDEGEGNGINTMRIAGAYNLGFFIFYFLFFKLLCVYGKEKQQ